MTPKADIPYIVTVFCQNCLLRDSTPIPFGKPVAEYPCPRCGCKTLETAR
jgi:hypothetical protein